MAKPCRPLGEGGRPRRAILTCVKVADYQKHKWLSIRRMCCEGCVRSKGQRCKHCPLLGIRIKGAAETKRVSGGYLGRVPDGFTSVEDEAPGRKSYAKKSHHIEQDPERAKVWRMAWDLLLEDKFTLEEIAEELHMRGYHYRSGRPFVEVKAKGKRKVHYNTMSHIFHNWTYAGWIVNIEESIMPKTLRGNWEPIVTTEEFEKGLEILGRRQAHRVARRRHDYLLKGLIFIALSGEERLHKLTCSTSNASRKGGGTAYYCVARSDINLLCCDIDAQIPTELMRIQVNPELIPAIQERYTRDVAQKLGHLRPDERTELEAALKSIDDEEARTARLFALGKITEAIWDKLWAEWEDRRRTLRSNIESIDFQQDYHINNLDVALRIIARVGLLYNSLERSDQKELLRLMVEKVVVDAEGKVRLELRAPFAYLYEISERVLHLGETGVDKNKNQQSFSCWLKFGLDPRLWALKDSNLQPISYEPTALPLS